VGEVRVARHADLRRGKPLYQTPSQNQRLHPLSPVRKYMLLGLRRAARLPLCACDSISLRLLQSSFLARFAAHAVLVRHPSTRTAFLMPPSITPNPRNDDRPLSDEERPAKRVKLDSSVEEPAKADSVHEDFLPPSSRLFQEKRVYSDRVLEQDVGIREYISQGLPPLQGIIKQRFVSVHWSS